MARKRKELPLLEKVTITDVAAEGKAIAKVNDLVVFVPYVVPGDVVDLQIKRKKNKYAEAEAVKFHELSPLRAVPFCQHYARSLSASTTAPAGDANGRYYPMPNKSGINRNKWKTI